MSGIPNTETDPIDHDLEASDHRVRVDPKTDSLAVEVVTAVAATTGRDVTDLPPLHDVVDPDALEALFGPMAGERPGRASVSFPYLDRRVTLHADGRLHVRPLGGAD